MMHSTRKEIADAVIGEYNRAASGHVEQLYNCNEWIVNPDNSDFIILQSYSTIVAAFQRCCLTASSTRTAAPPRPAPGRGRRRLRLESDCG